MNKKNILLILFVAVSIIAFIGLVPLMEIEKKEVQTTTLFNEYSYPVPSGYYTWRAFDAKEGSYIEVTFLSLNYEVDAYLFTENQYLNHKNSGDHTSLDSLLNSSGGKLRYNIISEGKYYFTLSGSKDNSIKIDFSGTLTQTITSTQKGTIIRYLFSKIL